MKVCIAEKPSVAREIAEVLGATQRMNGYIEGNGYQVTWTFGHLCTLKEPHEYAENWKRWSLGSLPMIPPRFGIKLIENPTYEQQFKVIESLMQNAEMVINCGDAGQEGELIQRWVMQKAGCKCPVYRLWISSLTEEAIREGFQKLKEQTEFNKLYEAGLSRAIGDWLLGMNATRLYTLRYGQNRQVLSIGRVQTPTLALIVNRQAEIDNFKPEPYWELKTIYRNTTFSATKGKFTKKEEGEAFLEKVKEQDFTVTSITEKKGKEFAPRLFDLTSLQVECNKKFAFTADDTLKLIQSLYEKKVTTYPRVDTTFLSDDIYPKVPNTLKGLVDYTELTAPLMNQKLPKSKKVFDNSKVTDHHAIIPTMEVAKADIGELKERNRKILYLISARVLTATADPYIYESHKCQITCNYHTFYLTAKKTKQEGFKAIENKLKQFFGVKIEKEEPELDIWAGKHYGPCDSLVSEHFTQPPKQYTEDTLLSAMERAGNEELTEDTEKKGLGTPATRAAIIEKLIQSGFVKREKKNLVPTDDGNVLITVLPDEIKSPKMTAEWEMALNHIAQNTETADEFLNGITELMQELVARYQGISEEKKNQFQGKAKGEVIGKCPRCGADVQEGKVNFYCSDRNCTFTLWKNDKFLASQGKKMDKTAAKKFLSKGKIHYKDLVSRKTGRQYEATVEMVDPGEGNVQFNLIFPQR
mgnify:CR=1 FL=1